MFCDSDDWAEPDWCEQLLTNYKDGCLVMCGYFNHFSDGVIKNNCNNGLTIDKKNFLGLLHIGAFAPWNKIFYMSIIKEHGIRFPEDVTIGEDKLFIWRYIKNINGNLCYINKSLYNYKFTSGTSLTSKIPRMYYKQCLLLFKEIIDDITNGEPCSNESLEAFYDD